MARPASSALRSEIARLEEQAQIAETLETAQEQLVQTQGEVSVAQHELARLRAAVLAETGKLQEVEQHQADARKVLVELGAEREAIQREIQKFARIADEGTKRFRLELQGLLPEPDLTEEEVKNA